MDPPERGRVEYSIVIVAEVILANLNVFEV